MKTIKALTFKEKQEELEHIFLKYNKARLQLLCLQEKEFYPQIDYSMARESHAPYNTINMVSLLDDYICDKEELTKIIKTFEMIMNCLSHDSKMIIEKEFIEKDSSQWYLEYYSKSTYYRMKTRAMEELLFYLCR